MEKSFFLSKRQQYDDMKAQLDIDFATFRPQYMELNDYFLPTRGRFILSMDSNRGDKRNNKIIDPTGYLAARTLSSGMQAGVTSPARPWKRLTTPDPDLAEFGPVRDWLEVVDQRMSTFFLRSNLYNVLPVSYGDLGVFGTAATFMDKDAQNVANFMSLPLGSYRIARNFRGQVNVFYREFRMTVRQLISHFGRKDAESGMPDWSVFSQQVRNLYDRGQYETWIEVCHIIEPNPDFNPRRMEAKYKRFFSCHYERGAFEMKNYNEPKFLRESGYDFFPLLIPRWQVTGQDVYGTDCPGMISLGDNKQLQHGEKRGAQAIDKMINPALKASASLKKTKASIVSGDITYLDDFNDKFEAVHEVRIDLSHLDAKQEQIRGRIKRSFYEDLFLALTESDRRQITATEIAERKEEKLLALGPVLEQLNQDVLNPLIENMFFLMNEAGLIPPAPPELQGMPLRVEYISIMAQAQKMIGISSLDNLLRMATAVNTLDPTAVQKLNVHEYMDQYADALGTSSRIMRSDDQVQAIAQQQALAVQKQQKMEAITQAAGAARDLSQADMSKDSALTRLTEQAKAGALTQQ